MKTFIIPYAYYCSDDQYLSPKAMVIEAQDEREALRKAKEEVKVIAAIEEKTNDPDLTEEEAKEMIPSIWIEGEEDDEEGYVIGLDIIEI